MYCAIPYCLKEGEFELPEQYSWAQHDDGELYCEECMEEVVELIEEGEFGPDPP